MKISPLKPDLFRGWPLVLILLLAACGRPMLSPLADDGTILAFGDSLTAGVGGGTGGDYPLALQSLTGRKVINAGVSGETTAGGLRRLPGVLRDSAPDLMVLMEGGNDILRSVNPGVIRDNLAAMIELAQADGVEVVLVGVPDRMLFSSAADYYEELASRYQLLLIDGALAGLLRDTRYKSDPIHLNAEGYTLLAEAVFKALEAHGAL